MYRHSMICLLIGLLLSACTLPLSTTQQATDENAKSPWLAWKLQIYKRQWFCLHQHRL